MGSVIVIAFITVDGVVEDPDGSWDTSFGGWAARQGPGAFAGDRFRLGPVFDSGVLLFGRGTWELFATRWSARTGEFADAMNRATKLVASRSLDRVDAWANSSLLDGDLLDEVARLRAERDVVVMGSTSVAHQLAAAGLVDEYRLRVMPIVVGAGERLFAPGAAAELHLVSSEPDGQNLLLRYRTAVDRDLEAPEAAGREVEEPGRRG
jgi:dihydrofolate reductase